MAIKVFADGANLEQMLDAHKNGSISGFTTNPTLMRQAGISDYERFAKLVLASISDLPISFEVFADDLPTMVSQARKIAAWGKNVYVKIPVTTTQGLSTASIVTELSRSGIKLNITAILTLNQVETVVHALSEEVPAIVSVFAGRIADTGRDPIPLMVSALALCRKRPLSELLWASPREVLNIYQAEEMGCHIITVTPDLLKKLALKNKDLTEYSRDTVSMFYKDAEAAGYRI